MIATIFGWSCVVFLFLTAALEPKEPKKDGRFRTGYKNNAKLPIKSASTKNTQKIFIIIAAISGVIWYISK